MEVEVFRPGLRWNYTFNLVGDIIVYIFSIFLLVIYFKTIIRKKKKGKLAKFTGKLNFVLTLIFMIVQLAYLIFNTISVLNDDGI